MEHEHRTGQGVTRRQLLRGTGVGVGALAFGSVLAAPAGASILRAAEARLAAGSTSPVSDGAVYDPAITPPEAVIAGWPGRKATVAEIREYVELVAAQSPRVVVGDVGTSYSGRVMPYCLVSSPANLARVDGIVATARALRDPRVTTPAQAAALAASEPAIAWYTANVHGNEPSGADASLSILYELAARTDAEVGMVLDRLLIGVMPTQNPDGREANNRRNSYGFDMNRDWFAWTQREVEAKVDLLRSLPPVVLVDAHEMGGTSFFFPPNPDPIHHEISRQSLRWMNEVYGAAMAAEFTRRNAEDPLNWQYFIERTYDLFYMGYGDTMPSTAFTAAGMTFEKGGTSPYRQKWLEQLVAGWTTLREAAANKEQILLEYHQAHVEALDLGRTGRLAPNRTQVAGNQVSIEVPDMPVRHYFLDPARGEADVRRLVDRLVRLGVEVHRLAEDLPVGDLRRYGRAPEAGLVPAGWLWIPLAQPMRRWVQAVLGEDSYTPFPYFYDVTAWSHPLLDNVEAAFSGEELAPAGEPVAAAYGPAGLAADAGAEEWWFAGDTGSAVALAFELDRQGLALTRLGSSGGDGLPGGAFTVSRGGADRAAVDEAAARHGVRVLGRSGAPARGAPFSQPRVAVYAGSGESADHLRWLLEQRWGLPHDRLTAAQMATGALTTGGYDVLVVHGGSTADLAVAREQIRLWILLGGTYVGFARPGAAGGTPFALTSGYTTALQAAAPTLRVPGTMFRVALDGDTPLTLGAPRYAYWYHLGEAVLQPTLTGRTVGRFPAEEPDFWFSGYAEGADVLAGSAALVEERLGSGRVVLFSGEPTFRAFTGGTALLVANAIASAGTAVDGAQDVAAPVVAPLRRAAMASVPVESGPGRPLQVRVAAGDAQVALGVLRRLDPAWTLALAGGAGYLELANPAGVDAEHHPFARQVVPLLEGAGVRVGSAIL